jgi:hypothetical protein
LIPSILLKCTIAESSLITTELTMKREEASGFGGVKDQDFQNSEAGLARLICISNTNCCAF